MENLDDSVNSLTGLTPKASWLKLPAGCVSSESARAVTCFVIMRSDSYLVKHTPIELIETDAGYLQRRIDNTLVGRRSRSQGKEEL